MRQFSKKVVEELGYYVYALIDPRDHKIFYIGKGCGNRVFQHCLAAILEDDETLKLDTIRAILDSGLEVGHYILRHRLSEEVALQMESLLIRCPDLFCIQYGACVGKYQGRLPSVE